jgi:hypothetical protein
MVNIEPSPWNANADYQILQHLDLDANIPWGSEIPKDLGCMQDSLADSRPQARLFQSCGKYPCFGNGDL